MQCNCGVCQECDWARTHFDELNQPLPDSVRLTYLSKAVADALFMLDNKPEPETVRNAWMDLNEAYHRYGRQD